MLPLLTREGDLFENPTCSGRPWNLRVHSLYVLRLMQKCIHSKQIFGGGFLKKGPPKEKVKVALIKDWKNYKNQQFSCPYLILFNKFLNSRRRIIKVSKRTYPLLQIRLCALNETGRQSMLTKSVPGNNSDSNIGFPICFCPIFLM